MYQNRDMYVERGTHRLYEIVNTFAISLSALSLALHAKAGTLDQLQPPGTFKATMACQQFKLGVNLPIIGPLEFALRGETARQIQLSVEPMTEPTWLCVQSSTVPGRQLNDLVRKIFTPHFVEFYEDYAKWLCANLDSDFKKWPTVWQFGRRVRDAISHGGKITINDPSFVPVTWYQLVYGPAQNTRLIFEDDLAAGDLFVLMLEMSDTLDA